MDKKLEDIVMSDKVQKLWDRGYQEELAWFGNHCVESYMKGYNKACRKSLLTGMIVGGVGIVLTKCYLKRKQKNNDESVETIEPEVKQD